MNKILRCIQIKPWECYGILQVEFCESLQSIVERVGAAPANVLKQSIGTASQSYQIVAPVLRRPNHSIACAKTFGCLLQHLYCQAGGVRPHGDSALRSPQCSLHSLL